MKKKKFFLIFLLELKKIVFCSTFSGDRNSSLQGPVNSPRNQTKSPKLFTQKKKHESKSRCRNGKL